MMMSHPVIAPPAVPRWALREVSKVYRRGESAVCALDGVSAGPWIGTVPGSASSGCRAGWSWSGMISGAGLACRRAVASRPGSQGWAIGWSIDFSCYRSGRCGCWPALASVGARAGCEA
jgi:hypothetical protein